MFQIAEERLHDGNTFWCVYPSSVGKAKVIFANGKRWTPTSSISANHFETLPYIFISLIIVDLPSKFRYTIYQSELITGFLFSVKADKNKTSNNFNISGLFSFHWQICSTCNTLVYKKKHNLKHINQTSTPFNIAHSISLKKKNYTQLFYTLLHKINNLSRCIQYYTQNMKDKLFDNFPLPVSLSIHTLAPLQ